MPTGCSPWVSCGAVPQRGGAPCHLVTLSFSAESPVVARSRDRGTTRSPCHPCHPPRNLPLWHGLWTVPQRGHLVILPGVAIVGIFGKRRLRSWACSVRSVARSR